MSRIKSKEFYIVTPFYNSFPLFIDTFQSVIKQTHLLWKWIIVDDNSDESELIKLKLLVAGNPKIILLHNFSQRGAGITRNVALDYIHDVYKRPFLLTFLDSDDVWYPQFLEKTVNFINNTDSSMISCSYYIVSEKGKMLVQLKDESTFLTNLINYKIPCLTTSIYIDDISFLKDCRFSSEKRVNDQPFFLSILKKLKTISYMDEPLAIYKVGRLDSVSGSKVKQVFPKIRALKNIDAPKFIKIIAFFSWIYFGIVKYYIKGSNL
jgi:teichuronic acid biosynthesis glycosyltransferase TuaG